MGPPVGPGAAGRVAVAPPGVPDGLAYAGVAVTTGRSTAVVRSCVTTTGSTAQDGTASGRTTAIRLPAAGADTAPRTDTAGTSAAGADTAGRPPRAEPSAARAGRRWRRDRPRRDGRRARRRGTAADPAPLRVRRDRPPSRRAAAGLGFGRRRGRHGLLRGQLVLVPEEAARQHRVRGRTGEFGP